MSTHNIPLSILKLKFTKIQNADLGFFCQGLKNEFETAVVNESSVFEPLKFYCIWKPASDILSILQTLRSNMFNLTLLLFSQSDCEFYNMSGSHFHLQIVSSFDCCWCLYSFYRKVRNIKIFIGIPNRLFSE